MKHFEGKSHYPIDIDHVPESWGVAFVGEVCTDIQSGFASGEHNAEGTGIPHLRPMNVDRLGHLDLTVVKSVDPSADARRILAGDVLFNNTNSPVLVGKTAPVVQSAEFAFSNHMTRLRPASGVDAKYLAHNLHYLWMGGFFRHRCLNHVNQASISGDTLSRTVPVAIAPTGEQCRIVDALDTQLSRLDAAAAGLGQVYAKLRAYRTSVLKAAVEGRLVPTEADLARKEKRSYEPASLLLESILKERRRRWEEAELARMKSADKAPPKDDRWKDKYEEPAAPDTRKLPPLPEGWCWASVDQVGDVLLGRQRAPQYLTGKHSRPYLRVANIKDDAIDFSDVETMDFDEGHFTKYQLLAGDILVSEGQSPHAVGQSAIYRGGIDGLCFQKTLHRYRTVPGGPSAGYSQLVFRANVKLGVYKALAPITTNIAHLTLGIFKASRFPLPPLAEQDRIEAEVDRLMLAATAAGAEASRGILRILRLRQAILKWAFEGKLVDQDPNDEPAHALLARIKTERETTTPSKKPRGRKSKTS